MDEVLHADAVVAAEADTDAVTRGINGGAAVYVGGVDAKVDVSQLRPQQDDAVAALDVAAHRLGTDRALVHAQAGRV